MQSAVIAAVAALLGLVVGRLWDSRVEARRWRRDHRMRVYERFIAAYYASREAYRSLALQEPGTAGSEEALARALDLGVDFNQAVVSVWFHGSPAVAAAVHGVDVEINKLVAVAQLRRYAWEEWRVARSPAEHAAEQFIEVVRRDLGLPDIPVMLCYPPHEPAAA
ncbi:hypothetical protein Daura_31610 [Dactylosporangium aurantiacum]|uniref:Uncharacterized protein n=1 Tax=Dactylosporangium aurantiacum TaxID=35754 RepID=A0A9Q9IBD3_9ACTN|nr:hypothetical protein [Dactylosporangium aurantiacum]MDG6109553.1 hypothetical protein [Dactylosporangium aurantiacum]UWZ51290.1 hypothetical protein Daura_31610 [Dactylosporangium aurantiacum]